MRRGVTRSCTAANDGTPPKGDTLRDFGGKVARLTGLEPATPGVTGRYSNQLSYNRPLRATFRVA